VALREVLSKVVSGSAGRLFEGPVREVVSDAVRDHDLASASEVDALRRRISDLDQRAAALEQRLAALERRAEDDALALAEARTRVAELEAAPAPGPEAAPPAVCQVPGCGGEYRSKGFCSAHYQRWRRGTLSGYVLTDGTVQDGARRFKVDVALAGAPAEVTGPDDARVVLVGGAPVKAKAL